MWWFTLRKIFCSMLSHVSPRLHSRVWPRLFPEYSIGRGTYGQPDIRQWGEGAQLQIGAYCSIAAGVTIFLGGEHRMDWVTTYPFSVIWKSARAFTGHPHTKGDVIIGNDVWIGSGAVILSGVTIGDGAVIGCNAVVSRPVGPYEIVAGNPARCVRMRFSDEVVEQLLKIRWWNWPEKKIKAALPHLLSPDMTGFLAYAAENGMKGALL